jgi:hypothetical protein
MSKPTFLRIGYNLIAEFYQLYFLITWSLVSAKLQQYIFPVARIRV